jgi:hypothetical protein
VLVARRRRRRCAFAIVAPFVLLWLAFAFRLAFRLGGLPMGRVKLKISPMFLRRARRVCLACVRVARRLALLRLADLDRLSAAF